MFCVRCDDGSVSCRFSSAVARPMHVGPQECSELLIGIVKIYFSLAERKVKCIVLIQHQSGEDIHRCMDVVDVVEDKELLSVICEYIKQFLRQFDK